jgi:hypothetical protein
MTPIIAVMYVGICILFHKRRPHSFALAESVSMAAETVTPYAPGTSAVFCQRQRKSARFWTAAASAARRRFSGVALETNFADYPKALSPLLSLPAQSKTIQPCPLSSILRCTISRTPGGRLSNAFENVGDQIWSAAATLTRVGALYSGLRQSRGVIDPVWLSFRW